MGKIAIIGGGIAGVSAALLLNENITLFEKRDSLIAGPPFCHLHAGGNLYPDLPLKECKQLLKESIDFAKIYPLSLDYRPTVVTFPKTCKKEPSEYIKKLEDIKKEYEFLIQKDSSNKILGEPSEYYKIYNLEDIKKLAQKEIPNEPKTLDDWMISVSKYINLDAIKFPVIMIQEYGLNMFTTSASAVLLLANKPNLELKLNTEVFDVKRVGEQFVVSYSSGDALLQEKFDYVINAAGFLSGKIDDTLGYVRPKLVEFKAAYVTKWQNDTKFPEIIFHGQRGTAQGMAQFTPYSGNYFQLHGMSKEITLFKNGLVQSANGSSYAKLDKSFLEKIDFGWSEDEAKLRTKRAIEHFKEYIPKFAKEAKVTTTPLFGAQQIPGNNPELRAAEVSFEQNYARCEIVKVSSAIAMTKEIAKRFNLNYTTKFIKDLKPQEVQTVAKKIAKSRGYPENLGEILNPKKSL